MGGPHRPRSLRQIFTVVAARMSNLGLASIQIEGGAVWELPARDASVESVREALAARQIPEV